MAAAVVKFSKLAGGGFFVEVKVFNVELTGMVGQNLRKLEAEMNTFLSTREFISMQQSVIQDASAGKPRIIVTVVAKRKAAE